MKFRFSLFVWMLVGCLTVSAQDPVAEKYANLITQEDLKENLSILASDALEGRATGTRGQKMAAAFIRAHFEDLGLKGPVQGSYFQPVELYSSRPGDTYIKAGGTVYKNLENIIYFGAMDSNGEVSLPAVFVGRGRDADFDQVDVNGKAAVIMLGSEQSTRAASGKALEKGAKMVVLFNADADESARLMGQFKRFLSGSRLSLKKETPRNSGVFIVSPDVAAAIFKSTPDKLAKAANDEKSSALKKIKEVDFAYKTSLEWKTVKSDNVLGYLEGTDKKDELLVITAHYDHIGKLSSGEGDLINNGADDDGSGTVTVLQLAKAFAKAKADGHGPRRSILFMTVTGEEEGLLGSEYYSDNPIFPLENTVVNLNIDMVGRRDPQHKDSAPYVYVIGSDKLSTELHELSERVNNTYTKLIFDYTYNDQNHPDRLYYRSDHWNFAKKNIPIIFYFDGIHEDYHRPSDEVDKIEFDLLAHRAKCVFYTAWEIADR